MTRRSSHVSDERLVEICFDRTVPAVEDEHLASCETCAARRMRLKQLLLGVAEATQAEADAAFSNETLAAQRARILHRVELDGRPARVIAFPAASAADLRPLRTRPAARWIAAAAAAGLAIGLLAGHLAHDLPGLVRSDRAPRLAATSRSAPQPAVRVINASLSDEELLGEIETAVSAQTLSVLRPLNDLTPQ